MEPINLTVMTSFFSPVEISEEVSILRRIFQAAQSRNISLLDISDRDLVEPYGLGYCPVLKGKEIVGWEVSDFNTSIRVMRDHFEEDFKVLLSFLEGYEKCVKLSNVNTKLNFIAHAEQIKEPLTIAGTAHLLFKPEGCFLMMTVNPAENISLTILNPKKEFAQTILQHLLQPLKKMVEDANGFWVQGFSENHYQLLKEANKDFLVYYNQNCFDFSFIGRPSSWVTSFADWSKFQSKIESLQNRKKYWAWADAQKADKLGCTFLESGKQHEIKGERIHVMPNDERCESVGVYVYNPIARDKYKIHEEVTYSSSLIDIIEQAKRKIVYFKNRQEELKYSFDSMSRCLVFRLYNNKEEHGTLREFIGNAQKYYNDRYRIHIENRGWGEKNIDVSKVVEALVSFYTSSQSPQMLKSHIQLLKDYKIVTSQIFKDSGADRIFEEVNTRVAQLQENSNLSDEVQKQYLAFAEDLFKMGKPECFPLTSDYRKHVYNEILQEFERQQLFLKELKAGKQKALLAEDGDEVRAKYYSAKMQRMQESIKKVKEHYCEPLQDRIDQMRISAGKDVDHLLEEYYIEEGYVNEKGRFTRKAILFLLERLEMVKKSCLSLKALSRIAKTKL